MFFFFCKTSCSRNFLFCFFPCTRFTRSLAPLVFFLLVWTTYVRTYFSALFLIGLLLLLSPGVVWFLLFIYFCNFLLFVGSVLLCSFCFFLSGPFCPSLLRYSFCGIFFVGPRIIYFLFFLNGTAFAACSLSVFSCFFSVPLPPLHTVASSSSPQGHLDTGGSWRFRDNGTALVGFPCWRYAVSRVEHFYSHVFFILRRIGLKKKTKKTSPVLGTTYLGILSGFSKKVRGCCSPKRFKLTTLPLIYFVSGVHSHDAVRVGRRGEGGA